jgi:hypothetical protein
VRNVEKRLCPLVPGQSPSGIGGPGFSYQSTTGAWLECGWISGETDHWSKIVSMDGVKRRMLVIPAKHLAEKTELGDPSFPETG